MLAVVRQILTNVVNFTENKQNFQTMGEKTKPVFTRKTRLTDIYREFYVSYNSLVILVIQSL